jgi:hypothetical protein
MKKRSGHLVYASVAQAYSTDVEPFALKGANIEHDQRRERQPYLNEAQSKNLLDEVLFQYGKRSGVMPDRVVIHKTTTYQPEEITERQPENRERELDIESGRAIRHRRSPQQGVIDANGFNPPATKKPGASASGFSFSDINRAIIRPPNQQEGLPPAPLVSDGWYCLRFSCCAKFSGRYAFIS